MAESTPSVLGSPNASDSAHQITNFSLLKKRPGNDDLFIECIKLNKTIKGAASELKRKLHTPIPVRRLIFDVFVHVYREVFRINITLSISQSFRKKSVSIKTEARLHGPLLS